MASRWIGLLIYVIGLLFLVQEAQAAVMSIDYGTEWFKVGLIKPGMPLDVALNKDSKRKTQSVVTIRHDERIYGSDAVSLVQYRPSHSSNVIYIAHLSLLPSLTTIGRSLPSFDLLQPEEYSGQTLHWQACRRIQKPLCEWYATGPRSCHHAFLPTQRDELFGRRRTHRLPIPKCKEASRGYSWWRCQGCCYHRKLKRPYMWWWYIKEPTRSPFYDALGHAICYPTRTTSHFGCGRIGWIECVIFDARWNRW